MRAADRLTFRTKLTLLVAVVGLAFGAEILLGALSAGRVATQLMTIRHRYVPMVELEPRLEARFEQIRRHFQDAVASKDVEDLAATTAMEQDFFDTVAAARTVDPPAAEALRRDMDEYCSAAEDVSRRLIANETGEAIGEAVSDMQAKQARALGTLRATTTFDQTRLDQAFDLAVRAEARAYRARLAVTIACLLAMTVGAAWLSYGVLRSVAALTTGLHRFGAGDFGSAIPIMSRDEIGRLAVQANLMAASLQRLGEARRKGEAKFRALLESAPDAMVIASPGGRIALVNAQTEKLFGYQREELVGHPVTLLVPERFLGADAMGWFALSEKRTMGSQLDLFARRKDGSEFPIDVSSGPLETEEGPLVSSAIRDITARKRIESELTLSNRDLEAFSYSVAHDLRAPLRAISGFGGALLEDCGPELSDQGRRHLSRIAAATTRMGDLIDALLGLSRVSRSELRREEVQLTRMAEAIVAQLRASQPGRAVEFVAAPNVVAHGDPALLRTLLENLLGNAWKFTAARSPAHIAFGAEDRGAGREYWVRDDGAGFDMTYAARLFTPFQRLHTTHEFAGTGIGLATVQRIVQRHGGRVWAQGAVDRGATFCFTLEAVSPGAAP